MNFKILFLVLITKSDINVWSPKILKEFYSEVSYDYVLANFGYFPYGHSIYGTVV